MTPCGAGISSTSPSFSRWRFARLSDTIRPRPAAVSRYITSASPSTGVRVTVSERFFTSVATIMTGVFRNTMRASRTIWTLVTPGIDANSDDISGGKRSVRITMSCDGITNRSGLSAASIQSMIEL